jgi:ribosomal protein S18 acetylase RimI-like enzyme
MEVRSIGIDDLPFLREMTLLAAFPPGPLPAGAAGMPRVTKWTREWGRPGDFGVVAWLGAERLGAAWCRVHEPAVAYGEDGGAIPELAIAVRTERRDQGIGAALLRGLLRAGANVGHGQICLAVNEANPALRLYERQGFREIRRDGPTLILARSTAT